MFLLSGRSEHKPAEQVCGDEAQHMQSRAGLSWGLAGMQRDQWTIRAAPRAPVQRTVCLWFWVIGGHRIRYPRLKNKATRGKKMLLCQTRFLGNDSFNYFNVSNHSVLLTFRTCLISSSDFRKERADICRWSRSTFGSCLTFRPHHHRCSLCFCLNKKLFWCFFTCLSPRWSFCLVCFFWTWQSLHDSAQISLPFVCFSCTLISPNSSPCPPVKHRAPHVYLHETVLIFLETCMQVLWGQGYPSLFPVSGTQWDSLNVYLSQRIFSEGYTWLLVYLSISSPIHSFAHPFFRPINLIKFLRGVSTEIATAAVTKEVMT